MQYARRAASAALTAALMLLNVPLCATAAQTLAAATQSSTPTQDVATQRQSEQTARANRAAAVPDETVKPPPASGNVPANAPRTSEAAPSLSYGPVLIPRGEAGQAARKDPAEVRDETDTLTREPHPPAATAPVSDQKSQQPSRQKSQQQPPQQAPQPTQQQQRAAARRHPSLQPDGALAPRPLRPSDESSTASNPEPIPAPTPGPQAIVPSSSVINSCQGSLCRTTSGAAVNLGVGNAGVNSSGRLCARTGATVQCF